MLTWECIERLWNFKFSDALTELTDEATDSERELVEALSIFGKPGWFMGGPMEVILNAAMSTIIPDTES